MLQHSTSNDHHSVIKSDTTDWTRGSCVYRKRRFGREKYRRFGREETYRKPYQRRRCEHNTKRDMEEVDCKVSNRRDLAQDIPLPFPS